MSLFQKSILNSIKQDESLIALRWAAFQNFKSKIDAIRGFKEEVYQDGFFKDIFESCLGYTLKTTNPSDYNLEREKKNETDGKKADGVIYVGGEIIGVVELKDQKSKNLDAVESQAFNYHASHSNSKYIIISNFDELRFYIDKKTAYERFSLFSLTYEDFKTLHLLLSFESIRDNIPLKLKEKSSTFEQSISKELYRDFSAFRAHLFDNIVKNNYTPVIPAQAGIQLDSRLLGNDEGLDKQSLLRLTQKLCDRIVFILFAEDRGLLRPNTIKEIREHFKNQAFTSYTLYDIYKFYFQAINEGNEKLNIPKYNGGLFATDELLDTLIIDDEYLDMEAQKLSDFDFVSDISVNILGHIFEQSLTDLEEMNAQVHDEAFDRKKSKRKKDGVFYTPEYITRYIVENTLGKLCTEKKTALNLSELEMPENPKKLTKSEKETLANLYTYRDWLLNLKILDPACGSGAFLNQSLEFLIREHRNIDEYRRAYENEALSLYDIETNILEHNLYGVDINEDAVEIARLSLWLRTAQKGRTLTNLSDKIKCGNSLIADKNVAENAFVWEEEFPDVFAHGGFDVVIGNPPYITFALGKKQEFESRDIEYLKEKFPLSSVYKVSSYLIFIEQSLKLISENGLLSFIVPNALYTNFYYAKFRELIIDKYAIHQLLNLTYEVFEDADTGGSSIFVFGKNGASSKLRLIAQEKDFESAYEFMIKQDVFKHIPDNKFLFSDSLISLWNKSFANSIPLGSDNFQFYNGIKTGDNDKFLSETKIDDRYKPIIRGRDFYKYTPLKNEYFVLFDPEQLWSNTNESMYVVDEKLIFRQTSDHLVVTYDNKQNFTMDTTHLLFDKSGKFNHKYLLTVVNSKLVNFLYQIIVPEIGKAFSEVKGVNLKQLPIKNLSAHEQQPFIEQADMMLDLNKRLQFSKQNFLNELHLEKTPQKLQNFEALEFDEFVKEYTKTKKIKFADKLEERNFKNDWSALFENDKKAVLDLKEQIAKTDKEIDAMVYALYGLSEDEIRIVEGKE